MADGADTRPTEDMADDVLLAIARRREELLDLCARLVEAPSVNPPGETTAPAEVVRDFLTQEGMAPAIVANVASKPNVVATCEGKRPGRHLVLNVHLDTMEPGDAAAWSVPPMRATRRGDGRLYGLGIGNMKGAVAAMSLAFVELARRVEDWAGRLTLTAVADEVMFGPEGAGYLLGRDPSLVGDGLLCGEGPGGLNLAVGEKGLLWLELTATHAGGHASAVRRRDSAMARLAQALLAVDDLNERDTPPPAELQHALPLGHSARRLTANIGTLQAGTVANQIAREARAVVDFRVPPGLSLDALQADVDQRAAPSGVVVRRVKGWEANWTRPTTELPSLVRQAAASVRGAAPEDVVRLPASDASRWRTLGVAAVCYGPQLPPSVGVDEYALEQDVLDCAQIYALTALRFLSSGSQR